MAPRNNNNKRTGGGQKKITPAQRKRQLTEGLIPIQVAYNLSDQFEEMEGQPGVHVWEATTSELLGKLEHFAPLKTRKFVEFQINGNCDVWFQDSPTGLSRPHKTWRSGLMDSTKIVPVTFTVYGAEPIGHWVVTSYGDVGFAEDARPRLTSSSPPK